MRKVTIESYSEIVEYMKRILYYNYYRKILNIIDTGLIFDSKYKQIPKRLCRIVKSYSKD